jgi:hypothetical protein
MKAAIMVSHPASHREAPSRFRQPATVARLPASGRCAYGREGQLHPTRMCGGISATTLRHGGWHGLSKRVKWRRDPIATPGEVNIIGTRRSGGDSVVGNPTGSQDEMSAAHGGGVMTGREWHLAAVISTLGLALLAGAAVARATTLTDTTGRRVNLAATPQRTVALTLGAVETLFALGAGPASVAISARLASL